MTYIGITESQIITILYALSVGIGFGLIKTQKRAECITKEKALVIKIQISVPICKFGTVFVYSYTE